MDQEVLYFKLVSGEDIISFVESNDGEYIMLHRPLELLAHNTIKGASVRMAKWSPYTEENDFPLRMRHVILTAKPTEEIEEFYLDALDALDQREAEREIEYTEDFNEDDMTMAMFERYSNTNIVVH